MNPENLNSEAGRKALEELFEGSPLLVEVAFGFVSSDWYLFQEISEFDEAMKKIGSGITIVISSVFDLTNPKGALKLIR